jgi:hypothetical protein
MQCITGGGVGIGGEPAPMQRNNDPYAREGISGKNKTAARQALIVEEELRVQRGADVSHGSSLKSSFPAVGI